jgi:NADPH:quinone reductase-like Zn-dependent oxidoreductase
LEIGEVEIPIPKENEVLVKIIYTAVNRAETMQVKIKVFSDFLKI